MSSFQSSSIDFAHLLVLPNLHLNKRASGRADTYRRANDMQQDAEHTRITARTFKLRALRYLSATLRCLV